MADITKCKGEGCIKKRLCYRFTATDSPQQQAYFADKPNTSVTQCDSFWSNKGRNFKQTKRYVELPEDKAVILKGA